MTIQEFKEKIATSTKPELFNKVEVSIEYLFVKTSINFSSVIGLYQYVSNQNAGWKEMHSDLDDQLSTSISYYRSLKEQLEYFINQILPNPSSAEFDNLWKRIVYPQLEQVRRAFPYDCSETSLLQELIKKDLNHFYGAYLYFQGDTDGTRNFGYFNGALRAFMLWNANGDMISSSLNKDYGRIEELMKNALIWMEEVDKQHITQIKKLEQGSELHLKGISEIRAKEKKEVEEWVEKTKKEFGNFDQESKKKIDTLEKTYDELLRLRKPAEYWHSRAEKLNSEGWKAMRWMIVLVAFACLTLYALLWWTPEDMMKSLFKGDSNAIRWSIVYVTFISFLAYAIRIVHKVAFSSFHLARDAQEREQLTYVYIAMSNDKMIDEKDKSLIMQSLFSRADTGLLKDDSAPTMPGNISDRLMKN